MKQLLRAGISMLAVLAALMVFSIFMPARDTAVPVAAAKSAGVQAQAGSVTLPPYTPQPIPPTASPVPAPFDTEQEMLDYMSGQLAQEGYQEVQADGLAAFSALPESYCKMDGIYMRPDPGGSGDPMYLQCWYDTESSRILKLQQVYSSADYQLSQGIEIYNLQSFPYFETGNWISFRANYSARLEDSYVNAVLYSPDRLLAEDVEFMSQIA